MFVGETTTSMSRSRSTEWTCRLTGTVRRSTRKRRVRWAAGMRSGDGSYGGTGAPLGGTPWATSWTTCSATCPRTMSSWYLRNRSTLTPYTWAARRRRSAAGQSRVPWARPRLYSAAVCRVPPPILETASRNTFSTGPPWRLAVSPREFTGGPGECRYVERAQPDDSGPPHLPHLRENRSVIGHVRRRRHDDQHRTAVATLTSPLRTTIPAHAPVANGSRPGRSQATGKGVTTL